MPGWAYKRQYDTNQQLDTARRRRAERALARGGSPRAAEEASDRVRDEVVHLLGGDDPGGHQCGDALHGGEEEEADALGLAWFEQAGDLAFLDQLEDDREGTVGHLVQRSGLLAVFAGEHQLEQPGVADREVHVCRGGSAKTRLVVLSCALDRGSELRPIDVLITTVGVERVKSPLYGADFSDPAVLHTLIDHLIDMLLAATMPAPFDG